MENATDVAPTKTNYLPVKFADGIPYLIKRNITTADGNTTANYKAPMLIVRKKNAVRETVPMCAVI